jgi:hypothetical protein
MRERILEVYDIGEVLTPGVYTLTDASFSARILPSGGSNDVFIIQTTGNLLRRGNQSDFVGGAQAKNIFWQIAGQGESGRLGNAGRPLVKTDVVFVTVFLNGRVFAQTVCNFQVATITEV